MKTYFYILFVTLFLKNLSFSQELWINEFSYNSLNDVDEFVEIVAPIGTDMSQYGLVFFHHNGSYTANSYNQLSGGITLSNSDNGKGFFIVMTCNSSLLELYTPIPNGITTQMVESEMGLTNELGGVLLINHLTGKIIHGICYELPISSNPPESIENKMDLNSFQWNQEDFYLGIGGIDIVRLPYVDGYESVPNGSISMIGSGFSHIWTTTNGDAPNISTPGALNYSQGALPVELSSFSASIYRNSVKLNWRTETEVNNYGFDVERKTNISNWESINFVNGNGNSNSPKDYSYTDESVNNGKYFYRLKQIDNDGAFSYSKLVEADFNSIMEFSLTQNYPNPFNPTTTFNVTLPISGNVKITIYNLLGQEVKTLANEFKESGVYTFNFDAKDLNSGIYLYKLEANGYSQTRKMTLIK